MATHQHRGENIGSAVFRTRLHPISLAGGATGTLLTLLGVWMIIHHNELRPVTAVHVAIYGALVSCLWLLGPALRFFGSEVVVRGDELLVTTDPFRGPKQARVGDIESVVDHAGRLGRQLGYGTVVIHGRQGTGATLRHVRDPADLCRALVERSKRSIRYAS